MPTAPIATKRFWLAALIPAAVGIALTALCLIALKTYGFSIFLLTPFAIGAISALVYKPKNKEDFAMVVVTDLVAYFVVALVVCAIQLEGVVCLAMAVPLAFPLTVGASAIVFAILKDQLNQSGTTISVVGLFLLVSSVSAFEASKQNTIPDHQVITIVEVDAPIEKVWRNVVEFPQIDDEPDGILRLGFAYPINARIEGTGIGATRYCNFNTGSFVEPITRWEEPHILAFDVREQPPIMIETGIGKSFHPAHLDYLRSRRGQFVLYERDGKTVVEGTTVYTHDIRPDWYWSLFSDAIIHRIHERVLDHIKQVSERE